MCIIQHKPGKENKIFGIRCDFQITKIENSSEVAYIFWFSLKMSLHVRGHSFDRTIPFLCFFFFPCPSLRFFYSVQAPSFHFITSFHFIFFLFSFPLARLLSPSILHKIRYGKSTRVLLHHSFSIDNSQQDKVMR